MSHLLVTLSIVKSVSHFMSYYKSLFQSHFLFRVSSHTIVTLSVRLSVTFSFIFSDTFVTTFIHTTPLVTLSLTRNSVSHLHLHFARMEPFWLMFSTQWQYIFIFCQQGCISVICRKLTPKNPALKATCASHVLLQISHLLSADACNCHVSWYIWCIWG